MTELFDAAAELGALADRRWMELDQDCRIPDDLQNAALAAGLFRTLMPVDLGGIGATPLEWFRCGIELGRSEASFGWVVTQGAVELGYIAAGGDPAWAAEVLGDPAASAAASVGGMGSLRETPDGLLFSGRWRFNTGVHAATWVGGLATIEGSVPPDVRLAYIPAERATIVDDWDPSGLRGSGSNSTIIPEQPIDPAWVLRPFSNVAKDDQSPYRCLLGNGNWPIACSVASTLLGAARRAIDETAAFLLGKASAEGSASLPNDAVSIRHLFSSEAMWNACHASVERELKSMWIEATTNGCLSPQQRVRLFAANSFASAQSLQVINTMCDLTGSLSIKRGHPLSRARRDAQALRAHRAVNGEAIEHAGRVWLGMVPEHRRI
jgi:alkylation response protein AidB-like acyl-CoA dehydrogenase